MICIKLLLLVQSALLCLTQMVAEDSRFELELGPCVFKINEPCRSDKLKFKLYRRLSKEEPVDINIDFPYIQDFDARLPFKLLMHGYGARRDEVNPLPLIRRAYLEKGDYNVVYVDWSALSDPPCYPVAILNTYYVSECVSEFLMSLERVYPGFEARRTHAIGFSIGAHVAAYVSDKIYAKRGVRLTRITGLDPALPLFLESPLTSWKYLDSEDADFVDIIHTNAGFLGQKEPRGHVDFYVNGGSYQAACDSDERPSRCSHLMAAIYFSESVISSKGFTGDHCEFTYPAFGFGFVYRRECMINPTHSRMTMGDACPKSARGVFVVTTNNSPPYARG